MELPIIHFYCISDDLFKSMHITSDQQCVMNVAKIATVALTAAQFLGGNLNLARQFLQEHNYMPHMLSLSRLCRLLHEISENFLQCLLLHLSHTQREISAAEEFIIDSFSNFTKSQLGLNKQSQWAFSFLSILRRAI